MKAITAPARDTYVPISTERLGVPDVDQECDDRPDCDRGQRHPKQIGVEPRPDPLVRPHQGGHHKEGKTDSHHDPAVGNVEAAQVQRLFESSRSHQSRCPMPNRGTSHDDNECPD